jgi:hypothetical protein
MEYTWKSERQILRQTFGRMKGHLKFWCATALGLMLMGCGKTQTADADVEETDPSMETAEVAETPDADAAQFGQALANDVDTALRQKNYGVVVETLGGVRQNLDHMTPQQRREYEQQLRNATQALIQARDSDPRAAQAYDQLSRRVLGR